MIYKMLITSGRSSGYKCISRYNHSLICRPALKEAFLFPFLGKATKPSVYLKTTFTSRPISADFGPRAYDAVFPEQLYLFLEVVTFRSRMPHVATNPALSRY